MAKTKRGSQRTRPMKVVFGGVTYTCLRKDGKVVVRTTRTAKGQNLLAGVYDIASKTWHNDNGDNSLPSAVKEHIARVASL
ncbi:hypothetical protein J6V85_02465 [Candidatus Saccharibacteria bacterium]|nr:hypothetical protein [Candidatus Saccharibacteria bacterium]